MMKRLLLLNTAILVSGLFSGSAMAQSPNTLLDILKEKQLITPREADSLTTLAQFEEKTKVANKSFVVGLEFRPRAEYRRGYKTLPYDTSRAAFFVSQRSRLNITYSQPAFNFHTSIQDIRIWGQYGQTSTSGSLNVFEAYVEPYFSDNLFLRIGRQIVELDNGRIFSAANWSQTARAHDGVNLIYKNEKLRSELMTFFNQTSERVFETDFSPSGFSNYKSLSIHYLDFKFHKYFSLLTLNAADGYQSKLSPRTIYLRGTSGGRLSFEKGKLYATLSGYYQYGQLQSGQNISAYYLQPEIQFKQNKFTVRLGTEYMSGDNAARFSAKSKSFVPLYGVAWRFMGNLDYFTTFPNDVKGAGLINPYLFLIYAVNKKLSLRADGHLFFLQNDLYDYRRVIVDPYLGIENDLSFKYAPNDYTTIDFGFLYMFADQSMELIKGGSSKIIPFSSYLMVTFKPELFNYKK